MKRGEGGSGGMKRGEGDEEGEGRERAMKWGREMGEGGRWRGREGGKRSLPRSL